jgi:hypothetical protein
LNLRSYYVKNLNLLVKMDPPPLFVNIVISVSAGSGSTPVILVFGNWRMESLGPSWATVQYLISKNLNNNNNLHICYIYQQISGLELRTKNH